MPMMPFLDIDEAFNNITTSSLVRVINEKGVPAPLCHWIKAALEERIIVASLGEANIKQNGQASIIRSHGADHQKLLKVVKVRPITGRPSDVISPKYNFDQKLQSTRYRPMEERPSCQSLGSNPEFGRLG
ncbi:hypothetical protein Trydic_g1861 [Trypoxylus dichotomus]